MPEVGLSRGTAWAIIAVSSVLALLSAVLMLQVILDPIGGTSHVLFPGRSVIEGVDLAASGAVRRVVLQELFAWALYNVTDALAMLGWGWTVLLLVRIAVAMPRAAPVILRRRRRSPAANGETP